MNKKIYLPIQGTLKSLEETPDEAFSNGSVGPGFLIIPDKGEVIAPFSGTISVLFPGGHAIGVKDRTGLDILIHIGVDTVNLKGEGFTTHVNKGDQVKKGDPLVSFDMDAIKEKVPSLASPVVFPGMKTAEILKQKDKDQKTILKISVE